MKLRYGLFIVMLVVFTIFQAPDIVHANMDAHEEIAVDFYKNNVCASDESIQNSVSISRRVFLYNGEGDISAKLYIFEGGDGRTQGYVVVDTNNTSTPIIEFGCGEQSFIECFEEKMGTDENITYYYLGGYQYVAAVGSGEIKYYNLLNGSEIEANVNLINVISTTDNGCNMRSTYSTNTSADVSGYDQTYYACVYFGDENNCGPVAGVNYCVYYYNNGKTGLKSSTWERTYSLLYEYMGTTETNGTYAHLMRMGMVDYMTERGYSCTGYDETNDVVGMTKAMIDGDEPALLCINGDATYGNHAVLALGYELRGTVIYFRIADGWTSRATRFICNNGGTLVDCISFVFD